MRHRLASLPIEKPALTLAAVLLLFALALATIVDPRSGAFKIPVDAAVDAIVADRETELPNDKSLIVALRFPELFSPDALTEVRAAIHAARRLPFVGRVDSLARAVRVDQSMGFLDVRGALDEIPGTRADAAALEAELSASPLYRALISEDRRSTLLVLRLVRAMPLETEHLESLREALGDAAPSAELRLSGTLYAEHEAERILLGDLARVLPLAVLALAVIAAFTMRSFRGVWLPLSSNAVALVLTLAIFAVSGHNLNIVTVIMPPVVFVVGFAYAIHVITEFEFQCSRDHEDRRAIGREALGQVTPPLALTVLTTAAGFLSLLTSRIEAIREFGVFCAVGVVVALLVALSALPALLMLLPTRASAPMESGGTERWAQRFADLAIRRRRALLLLGAAIAGLAFLGLMRVRASTDFVANFRPEAPIRSNFEALNREFDGLVPVEIELRAAFRDAFKDPENLARLDTLAAALLADPEVGRVASLADYVAFLYEHLGGPERSGRYPETAAGVEQVLLSAPNEGAAIFADKRFRSATLRVHLRESGSAAVSAWTRRVEARLAELPDHIEGRILGSTVRVVDTVQELTRGQVASVALALFAIFLTLALLFQSLRAGFLALIPNAIPVLVYFGVLGLFGIPLNVTTALVACAVLGIAVDDSIHFLTRFNEEARAQASEASGVAAALRHTLRPISVTTAALVAGFLMLTMSELRNHAQFGALAAFTLGFAWLLDVTFTPALCSQLRFVTLWEALTLDLGDAPHRTIPLFSGMSPREARIAALLGTIRSVSAGDRILQRGDPGGSLLVILDGEVEISVEGPGGRRQLATLGRGAQLGESSVFGGRRVADADASTNVRVLRWTRPCLDRIQQRHPRVAARMLRNLSETMAERFSDVTERYRVVYPDSSTS